MGKNVVQIIILLCYGDESHKGLEQHKGELTDFNFERADYTWC